MSSQQDKRVVRRNRMIECLAVAAMLCGVVVIARNHVIVRGTSATADAKKPTSMPAISRAAFENPIGENEIPARPNRLQFEVISSDGNRKSLRLCQEYGPTEPFVRHGVDCPSHCSCRKQGWRGAHPIPWQALTQGEYIGPPRTPHVAEYRFRVGDQIEFIYRRKREIVTTPYELNVGDKIRVESLTDEKINRELEIQADGKITLPPAFQVQAAGRTVEELTVEIEERYKQWYKVPAITVTPTDTERRLQDLLSAVDRRFNQGGTSQITTVTPEGTVQLPGIGNVYVQGLTWNEVRREVEERYDRKVPGIGVDPRLSAMAPHFIYVGGEVRTPNRFQINESGPTNAIMAIAMAGGWNYGANLREIVVLRRAEDWRLIATKIDLRGALLGNDPCPDGNIWLRDADIVYVPKSKLLLTSDFLDLFFTKGLYRIVPLNASYSTSSTLN